MKKLKRILYLFYYFRETNYRQLLTFLRYSSGRTSRPALMIIADAVFSVFRYNVSIKDYFCFRFFELDHDDRLKWAGTGFMYEYQFQMNPVAYRKVLEDKISFLGHFHKFVEREFYSIDNLKNNLAYTEKLLSNLSGRAVLKNSHGQTGSQVEVISCPQFTSRSLIMYMESHKYDLAEEYVIQHPALMELSPSGLNTVRVITQLDGENVEILGARLRISVNSFVDNMAAGNIAAPIDIETGTVNGPGVYSDITKEERIIHPVTGVKITDFRVPHWNAIIEMAKAASFHTPENRSVGWDIAVTPHGPELIEGNHNWCKLLWQLPVKKGLKSELQKYT